MSIKEELISAYEDYKSMSKESCGFSCGFSVCGTLFGSVYGVVGAVVGCCSGYLMGVSVEAVLKNKASDRLLQAIGSACRHLDYLECNDFYDQWIDLKKVLDPIENFYHDCPDPNDQELMKRFLYTIDWYGTEHFRVQAFFDQYKDRSEFVQHARIVLNAKQAGINNG